MHSRLAIFEIPHVLNLICIRLTTNDLISCTQVSSLWHGIFRSHLLQHIRFVDLKKETTWDILDHANRIKFLKIDIADGGWFLTDSRPTATATTTTAKETTPPYINLKELHCVNFGYFEEPTRPTDERYGDWVYPDATPTVEKNRIKPHASSGVNHTISNIVALTGYLLRLRESRLTGYYAAVNEEERQLIPIFLRQSSSTLEVISIDSSNNLSNFDTDPFTTAAWNFWNNYPRLREYAFVPKNYYRHIASDHNTIDIPVELLSRPTVTCRKLQKMKIGITDYSGHEECYRYSRAAQSQGSYEHQEHFLGSVRPLLRCLRSCKQLRQDSILIGWDLCMAICRLSLDEALLRINRPSTTTSDIHSTGLSHDNTSSVSSSSSSSNGTEATPLQPEDLEITRQDLKRLGLDWRWHSGEEKQQCAETLAKMEISQRAKDDTYDINAGTAWARSYRRVGCNWKDWRSLAGLYSCAPPRYSLNDEERVHDCDHVYCYNDVPNGQDVGLDRFLSGHDVKVERGHRRRSLLRRRRKQIK